MVSIIKEYIISLLIVVILFGYAPLIMYLVKPSIKLSTTEWRKLSAAERQTINTINSNKATRNMMLFLMVNIICIAGITSYNINNKSETYMIILGSSLIFCIPFAIIYFKSM